MSESIPKLGDKYAIITGYTKDNVIGPMYVVSVRGERVALAHDPQPEPKAKRDWRVDRSFPGELRRAIGDRFSSGRAELWSSKHETIVRREALKRNLGDRFDRWRSTHFEGLSIDQLRAMLAAVSIVPADLMKAIEAIEDASSEEKHALHRLGYIESTGDGTDKSWKVSARGLAAATRTRQATS